LQAATLRTHFLVWKQQLSIPTGGEDPASSTNAGAFCCVTHSAGRRNCDRKWSRVGTRGCEICPVDRHVRGPSGERTRSLHVTKEAVTVPISLIQPTLSSAGLHFGALQQKLASSKQDAELRDPGRHFMIALLLSRHQMPYLTALKASHSSFVSGSPPGCLCSCRGFTRNSRHISLRTSHFSNKHNARLL